MSKQPPERSGTAYVVGAGFTKAFCQAAPMLVDAYPVRSRLIPKYKNFPEVHDLLEMAARDPEHIDIERLLTRLSERMPYDSNSTALSLESAFVDVTLLLRDTIENAISSGSDSDALRKFASHFLKSEGSVVTFNYDTLLESTFVGLRGTTESGPYPWNPTWGYGLCLKGAQTVIGAHDSQQGDFRTRVVYKLHGSLNWRVIAGTQKPAQVSSVVTWQKWCRDPRFGETIEPHIEKHLEQGPLIVAPVLSKAKLLAEPVLRSVWTGAFAALRRSAQVVFIGYSLPLTDTASSYLLAEATRGLDPAKVSIIDYFEPSMRHTKAFEQHRLRMLANYRGVFPEIAESQFRFDGAAAWVEGL